MSAIERCDHGMPTIVRCSACVAATLQAKRKSEARLALENAHKCLFAAIQYLDDARKAVDEAHASGIADVAEDLDVQSETIEAIFGALVLRGGAQ